MNLRYLDLDNMSKEELTKLLLEENDTCNRLSAENKEMEEKLHQLYTVRKKDREDFLDLINFKFFSKCFIALFSPIICLVFLIDFSFEAMLTIKFLHNFVLFAIFGSFSYFIIRLFSISNFYEFFNAHLVLDSKIPPILFFLIGSGIGAFSFM